MNMFGGTSALRRPRFSTLSWQIIYFNAAALAILIVGTLLVQTAAWVLSTNAWRAFVRKR